ncbi:tetratricopeptide repeat protein 21B isoform X1 [Lepisosteus oculatus]|uniref:tetratricopeptide repeat protein 21B isoform X1 n=2 Tax=Lepisosteus oculatus TaxID=7918 RepID=UPI003722D2C0
MAESDPTCLASLTYYCREKYYHHVIQVASEYLKTYNNDPLLLFFKGYGILMEGRVQEAIRDLEQVKDKQDVSLCCIMALIYAHKQSKTVDREALVELETKLKTDRKSAGEKALYYAGMFLWVLGRGHKAKDYIDRMLKISGSTKEGLILKGWIELSSDKEYNRNISIKYFDEGVQESKNVLGLMGKVNYFVRKQNFTVAIENVNQIIVSHPDFLPALIIKMTLFLAQQDWDQAMETAHRILQRDKSNVKALQIMTMHALAKEGDVTKATEYVQLLIRAVETTEPCNPSLRLNIIIPISRVCGNNKEILQNLCELAERSFRMAPVDADAATEIGHLLVLQDNVRGAAKWYSQAMSLDGSSVPALTGVIKCQLLEGQLGEAEQQLEFLREVQQSIGKSGEVALLEAILASKKGEGQEAVSALLKEATELHFSAIEGLPLGVEYFEKLNPAFLFDIVKTHMTFCPSQPRSPGQALSFVLKHSAMILDPVVKTAPGILPAVYLMAKVKFFSGDLTAAHGFLTRCQELDPTIADVHLLQAQVYLCLEDYKKCFQSLETGLSHNFQVREFPLYHLIKARALKETGNLPEAIQSLKMIMSLPGIRRGTKEKDTTISIGDRVSVYLELAEALRLNGEQHEATKIMQDAIVHFTGTPEEIRVTIANVDFALAKDDTEAALTLLQNIKPSQQYYTEAKEKLAKVYLHKRKDKKLYIACYRELCEELPGSHTSLLLGDAYMHIQEPGKAIEIYQDALQKNTRDATLASRIGQALVKTHQYSKAIKYYETALKNSGQDFLCYDLAELLMKLKQYDKADKLLSHTVDHDIANDLPTMIHDVKHLNLLAKVYTVCGKPAMDTLNKAYDIQTRILRRLPLEQPEIIPAQKQVASSICCHIAQQFWEQKDFEKAMKFYKEALTYSEEDSKILLELARLYLVQGDVDSCRQQCLVLLKNEENNEDAVMLMADLLFRREEYEKSILHCTQLIEQFPDNYSVLAKLIDLLRRTGRLDDAPSYLKMSENHSVRAAMEPGYNYCKGLYLWHTGQPNEALKHFNKARKDTDWGENAIYNMIEICLNPDNETIGGEVFEVSPEEPSTNENERKELEQLAVKTAENLLKKHQPRTKQAQEKLQLLQNRCLMATKDVKQVEKALLAFTEMAKKNLIPSLLAMAQAFMILKQTPRARNQLKRLGKMEWNEGNAEEFEQSWLLLADIYISSGKYDIAIDFLKRCLLYNKSCCKAFEYLGFIMEMEQSYKDAANNYEMAWKYSNRMNPAVGFRLAFNYLKAKKYTEAIDVCQKVLTDYPGYPRIRKEILERAQFSLRP